MKRFATLVAWLMVVTATAAYGAQGQYRSVPVSLPKTALPFDRMFTLPSLAGSPPTGITWAPNSRRVAFLWNTTGERRRDVYVIDVPGGKPVRITDSAKIPRIARQDDERTAEQKRDELLYDGGPGKPEWSPDSRTLLFSYRGDMFEVPADGKGPLRRRTMSLDGSGAFKYSPDGKTISFMRGPNVFLMDRATGDTRQLTTISKADTAVSGYEWSPDSTSLLISWQDSSSSKSTIIPDYTTENVTVSTRRRQFVGQSQNVVKIGVVSVAGDGIVKWVTDLPSSFYAADYQWSPDSSHIVLSEMGSDFKTWRLRSIDARSLRAITVTEETSARYVTDWRPAYWSLDGASIYFGSDRDGWRHVWKVGAHGGTPEVVTSGAFDVAGFERPKHSDALIVEAADRDPTQLRVYVYPPAGPRHELTGSLPVNAPTFATSGGLESTVVSDDGRYAILRCADPVHAPDMYLSDAQSDAKEPVRLTVSQLPEFAKARLVTPTEVTFKAPDGATIHGLLWSPPDPRPGRRFGAVIDDMYADSAKYNWDGLLPSYMAAELGLYVLRCDFRSSWGYGADFASGYYHSLGRVDADEAVAGGNFLKTLPNVDPDRVGCWGWSYGGFLTEMIMFTRPGVFSAGVAVAPVTDWKHYNEWYTRHRLDEPKDAPEEYKKSSPINFASGLTGRLLMIHGMQDDNVLFQDTVQMVQKLIEAGKDFDVAFYPKDNHSIARDESRVHVFRRIVEYLYMWLG